MATRQCVAEGLGVMLDYVGKVLAAFETDGHKSEALSDPSPPAQSLIEPLSRREVEVLQLIAQGLSNQEISERLVLALETVKGHRVQSFVAQCAAPTFRA